jgi:hypothetical protein
MTMCQDWINWTLDMSCSQKDMFWSGARKVLNNRQFKTDTLDDSIRLEKLGYSQFKITRLQTQYFHQASFDAACYLHENNVRRKKYASASFHCYNHLLKSTYETRSSAGSVFGPCIQSVVLTLRPHERRTAVDIFYRTTEAFKKFPADLIWMHRNVLHKVPGQDQYPILGVTFHFVNVTIHPMYVATILPFLPDGIATLELMRNRDIHMWQQSGQWLSRYIIGGAARRSIESFAQSMRTARAAQEQMKGELGERMIDYLFKHREHFKAKRSRFDPVAIEQAFLDAKKRGTPA